jgi:pectate lyase
MVSGTITPANTGADIEKIDVKDVTDVSIIGAGSGAEFNEIGIKIYKASNIVLRNLIVHHVAIGDKDCIGIEGPADHIWIDHCELYNEFEGADKEYYDGLLDAKREAEYITYSWNYLHDSWKTALVGMSESDTYDRKITMHHNYLRDCNSRLPLFRAGNGHIFNNLYEQIASTGINSRIGACLKIENNYFDSVHNPWVSAYSDVLGGAELVCNITVNSVFDTSGSDTNEIESCTANVPYDYSAVLNDTQSVPDIVRDNVGAGKLSDPASF